MSSNKSVCRRCSLATGLFAALVALSPAVAFGQLPTPAGTSITSPVVTLDGAAQLDAGLGGVVTNGTLSGNGGRGGEVPNAAQLNVSMQAPLVWSPGVAPYSQLVVAAPSDARRVPQASEMTTFAWSPLRAEANSESSFLTNKALYQPTSADANEAAAEDLSDTRTENVSTSSAFEGRVYPVAALPGSGLPTLFTSPSCLDGHLGCGGLLVPTTSLAIPTSASRMSIRSQLRKSSVATSAGTSRMAKKSSRPADSLAAKSRVPEGTKSKR